MDSEKERAEGYLATIKRMEPAVHGVGRDGSMALIAISMKRQADTLEHIATTIWGVGLVMSAGVVAWLICLVVDHI